MVGQHWPGWPPGSSSPGEGHTLPQPQDGLSLSLCADDGSHTPLLSNYCLHAPAHGLLSSVSLGPCFCRCVLILCTQSQSRSWPGEPHSWGSLKASRPQGMSLPILLTAERQPWGTECSGLGRPGEAGGSRRPAGGGSSWGSEPKRGPCGWLLTLFILLFFLLVSVAGRYRREPMTHVREKRARP